MGDPLLPLEDDPAEMLAVRFTPRLLLDLLSTRCLARLYRHSTPKLSADDEELLGRIEGEAEDRNGAKTKRHQTPGQQHSDAVRAALLSSAEASVREFGAKGLVNGLKRTELKEAMAGVPIDHGQNNPNNKRVLQKRLTEILSQLGAEEYARRFVHSVEVMAMLCRASDTDETSLDEVLTLQCSDLEMDDGEFATKAELKSHKLEELQRLLGDSVNRIGAERYLWNLSADLLRLVCRNLGVNPNEGLRGGQRKQTKVDKLVELIFSRVGSIQPTGGRPANDLSREDDPHGRDEGSEGDEEVRSVKEKRKRGQRRSVESEDMESEEYSSSDTTKATTPTKSAARSPGGGAVPSRAKKRRTEGAGEVEAEVGLAKTRQTGDGEEEDDDDGDWVAEEKDGGDVDDDGEQERRGGRKRPKKKDKRLTSKGGSERKGRPAEGKGGKSEAKSEGDEESKVDNRRRSSRGVREESGEEAAREEVATKRREGGRKTAKGKAKKRRKIEVRHQDEADDTDGEEERSRAKQRSAKAGQKREGSEAEDEPRGGLKQAREPTQARVERKVGEDKKDEDGDGWTQRFFGELRQGASKLMKYELSEPKGKGEEKESKASLSEDNDEIEDDDEPVEKKGHEEEDEDEVDDIEEDAEDDETERQQRGIEAEEKSKDSGSGPGHQRPCGPDAKAAVDYGVDATRQRTEAEELSHSEAFGGPGHSAPHKDDGNPDREEEEEADAVVKDLVEIESRGQVPRPRQREGEGDHSDAEDSELSSGEYEEKEWL